ncbi:AraC family transcriptional regulator [Rhizobium mesoamericanum]|uniref:AraC family transcriptional regulator n=1 Tax=Rhizobium mesoamericanum TaxID=1079800 RepID=UPI00048FA1F1|nr:AraC family transcriptional regulator [Rhizobium mesoamericanum]
MSTAQRIGIYPHEFASIRASVLVPLIDQIDRRSGKADGLLALHGLLRSQLDDPYAMVPMNRYIAIFEDAARIVEEPTLGARLGTLFKPSDIGPIGVLFSISGTIRSGFERLAKYVNTVQSCTNSGVFEEDGNLVWSYRLDDPRLWPRRQDSEFTVAASCQLVRSCFARAWRPVEVHFEHVAPRDSSSLQRIFRAPLRFGESANRIVMSGTDATRIYRQEQPDLAAVLERHIAEVSGWTPTPETAAEKVRALVAIYLGHKPITLPDLAFDLKISARTLQRRLSEEGTSLRNIVRDYRRSILALRMQDRSVKMKRLAQILGYADETALWRARKHWDPS